MNPFMWINVILIAATGFCTILFTRRYIVNKTLMDLYFALAATILLIPYLFDMLKIDIGYDLFGWAKLVAIITYISGLLVLIRQSKPVFARFPLYLTALPFISLLFFPFMIESFVIKDLLNAIYQGGALVATGLIFSFNYINYKGRRYYLIGIGSAILSYIAYWSYFNRVESDYMWISEMLLALAIVVTSYKFINTQDHKNRINTV